jgi:hypothetical protein
MSQVFRVFGEMTDNRHVTLDRPIPLEGGKVRLIVEPISTDDRPSLAGFEESLRHRQQARGHVPRTKEEVDDYLRAERDSWDS